MGLIIGVGCVFGVHVTCGGDGGGDGVTGSTPLTQPLVTGWFAPQLNTEH